MKTKILLATILIIIGGFSFVASWSIEEERALMLETYRAEAIAMDKANECFRAIGSYSAYRCMLWTRNVKNGAVK